MQDPSSNIDPSKRSVSKEPEISVAKEPTPTDVATPLLASQPSQGQQTYIIHQQNGPGYVVVAPKIEGYGLKMGCFLLELFCMMLAVFLSAMFGAFYSIFFLIGIFVLLLITLSFAVTFYHPYPYFHLYFGIFKIFYALACLILCICSTVWAADISNHPEKWQTCKSYDMYNHTEHVCEFTISMIEPLFTMSIVICGICMILSIISAILNFALYRKLKK